MKSLETDEILFDIGRRIAELRTERELTQEQLAELAGITAQYLQRVEGGRENLTIRSLVRFANLLEVQLQDLLTPPKEREIRISRPRRTSD